MGGLSKVPREGKGRRSGSSWKGSGRIGKRQCLEGLKKEEEGGIVFQPEGTFRKARRHTVCSVFLTSQEPNLEGWSQ